MVAFNKHYKHIPEMEKESIKIGAALCAICHLPEDKAHKKLNDYGAAFGARMTRADYYRLVKEAKEAKEAMDAVHKKAHETFEKTEYDKSPSGELYGDRIRKGVLPASSK
ncbi:MAG: hypothetical protein K8R36_07305 [Planctomycetales bacterium]|nr:hypothetical protein [Planctomycetales bacterium]